VDNITNALKRNNVTYNSVKPLSEVYKFV